MITDEMVLHAMVTATAVGVTVAVVMFGRPPTAGTIVHLAALAAVSVAIAVQRYR